MVRSLLLPSICDRLYNCSDIQLGGCDSSSSCKDPLLLLGAGEGGKQQHDLQDHTLKWCGGIILYLPEVVPESGRSGEPTNLLVNGKIVPHSSAGPQSWSFPIKTWGGGLTPSKFENSCAMGCLLIKCY